MQIDAEYLAPRRCLREPINEAFRAAELLSQAADYHLQGERKAAAAKFAEADIPQLTQWTDSLWGSRKNHPEQQHYLRYRVVEHAPSRLAKADRIPVRMPSRLEKKQVIDRWGRHCAFCGMPLIRPEVRKAFSTWYPDVVRWGTGTYEQHSGFQSMWMQFDHVLPHSRGGDNSLDNLVVTCAGCNFGRMDWTLEELGLSDPRLREPIVSSWDGLERVFS